MKHNLSIKEKLIHYCVPEPNSGCWLWVGSTRKSKYSYGNFKVGKKIELAHRASFACFVKEIPKGLLVLHKCDTPSCVNPDHLFLGTQSDNMIDMVKKNRHPIFFVKSHCVRGHELNGQNLRFTTIKKTGKIKKVCKSCMKIHQKKFRGK